MERACPPGFTPQVICPDPKLGAKIPFQVSHMGAGSQGFGLFSAAFPGHKQGAGWEAGLLGLEPAPVWDPGVFKERTSAAMLSSQAPFVKLQVYLSFLILF